MNYGNPRFERAAQAQYHYGPDALAASSVSALSTVARVSAGSSDVALGSRVPLVSFPLPDTRKLVPQVSTIDPTGSATPGGGHRTVQPKVFGSPAFGQSGAKWGTSFCEVGSTPSAYFSAFPSSSSDLGKLVLWGLVGLVALSILRGEGKV